MRTVGVEEEFLLVDPRHDRMSPVATRALRIAAARGHGPDDQAPRGALVHELQEQQLEIYTAPHSSMSSLGAELRAWRTRAAEAVAEVGAELLASGTAPIPVVPQRVHTPRYDEMAERFGIVTDEQLTCGCHVHVSVTSPDEAVGVLDRIRVWLPTLLALSANSPYWQGRDTGYASFRSRALRRWPVSGPTALLGDAESYRTMIGELLASGVVMDPGMLYFDARCSHRYPTVEIRVPDVCPEVDDALLLAALCRALVETAAAEWAADHAAPQVPTGMLEMATWQAARWGISEKLLDPLTCRPRAASDVVAALLDHIGPALADSGDRTLVDERLDRLFVEGNGATRQRDAFAKSGQLGDVVAELVRATTGRSG